MIFKFHTKLFKDHLIKCKVNQLDFFLEVFKINNNHSTEKSREPGKEGIDQADKTDDKSEINDESETNDKLEDKPEKIETCYFCLQKFDINQDDCSHYKYGKFPMCDYCSQFYGFYDEK